MKRLLTYALVVTTMVWSVGLLATPLAVGAAVSGDLIKLQCPAGAAVDHPCKAVYYVGADGKRYAFPNEKIYKTWYSNFSGVMVVSDAEMASYTVGGNVTYRPGVKLVKITTDPKVYAVGENGKLRWITDGAAAAALYGANWAKTSVDDLPDVFLFNYTYGADIDEAADFDPAAETAAASSINADKDLAGGGASNETGSLTVALAPDTPASGLAICTAIRVPFTKVNITNNSANSITIDSLKVQRGGVASDTNFGSLAIIDANTNVQIGLNQNLNSSHEANFNNDFTVPANSTKSIILAGNMNPDTASNCTSAAGNVPALSLVSVTPKSTGVTVSGSLPITGNFQTINGVTIGQTTVNRGTYSNATSTTLKVGQTGYVLASLKLTADSTEGQKIEQFKFYQSGTAALASDIENWKVYQDNVTNIPATVTVDGKYVTIDITNNPVTIEKGKNATFTFKADIVSGSSRTIKMVVYRETDIVTRGTQYGQARVPSYSGTGAGGTGEVMSDNQFTISAGTLRVDANNTAVGAQNVAYGDEQTLGSWNFVVQGEAVQITQLVLSVSSTSASSLQFDNVKLVDGSGKVLMGPSSSFASGSVTFTETVEIPVGTNVVKVVSDVESDGGFATNETFNFSINPSNITATGADTNDTVTATPGAAVNAATQTFKGVALVVTRNALPVSGNAVLGSQDFLYGSWQLDTTNSGEPIRITAIKAGNRAGSTTNVDNLTLYDKSKTTQSACQAAYPGASFDAFGCALQVEEGSSGTTTFTLSDPMVLARNTQTSIELRGDVRTTAATYVGHVDEFMLYVDGTATDVITAVGVNTNNTVTPSGTGITETGAAMTIVAAGSLTVNTAASTNNSLVAVNSTVELNRIKLSATNEAVDLEELALCVGDPSDVNGSETGDSDDITEFKVYKSTDMTNPIITGNIGSGVSCRTFSLTKGTVQVPKDSSTGVELVIKGTLADVGTGLPGTAGADFQVGIGGTAGIKGTGAASNTSASETYTASTSSIFKLVKGYPTVSLNTLPSSSGFNAGSIMSDFTVTNPTANPIAVYRLSFYYTTSTDADLQVDTARIVTQADGKTVGADAAPSVTGPNGEFFTFALQDEDDSTRTKRAYRIGAGQSVRFQLVAGTVSGTDSTADGSISTYLSGDTATSTDSATDVGSLNTADWYQQNQQGNFVWSDLWSNDAWDSNAGNATETAQWWNGYLVSGLSSASSTAQVIQE